MPDSMSAHPKKAAGAAPTAKGKRRSKHSSELPADLAARLDIIREQYTLAMQHQRREAAYYLAIGEQWYAIKDDDELLDRVGGITALQPFLPNTPPFLNRCAVMWDGHITRDLAEGEKWVKHTRHSLRNIYEPYRSAEIVEAYRNRLRPGRGRRSPIALTEEGLFAQNDTERFDGLGSAIWADCHSWLPTLPEGIVDFICTDPTFGFDAAGGKTEHEWDVPVEWASIWPHLWRVLAPNGTIAISASEPLASELIHSQLEHYLFNEYWLKKATNVYARNQHRPLDIIEPICLFSRANHRERTYNPQMISMEKAIERTNPRYRNELLGKRWKSLVGIANRVVYREQYPTNLIVPDRSPYDPPRYQHCQKPVNLVRQLILTYSNEGDLVLDFTAGSMTTGVACWLTNRKFIGIEQHEPHYVLGCRRLRRLTSSKQQE
jgi:site-specific DNA-methyltransferase (adenine-specific)